MILSTTRYFLLFLILGGVSLHASDADEAASDAPAAEAPEEEVDMFDRARQYYDRARQGVRPEDKEELMRVYAESVEKSKNYYDAAKGWTEESSAELYNWVKEDINNLAAWEYQVIRIPMADADMINSEMNRLGMERWECITAVPAGDEVTLFFKRAKRSYLRHIPTADLLRLLNRDSTPE